MSSTASAPTERRGARAGARIRRGERHPEGLERLRILLAGAMGAIIVGYALLVPVAALLLLSGGGGSLDGSFAIAVPMWLAANQIPVEIEGRALGLLPLLPTVVLVVVVAVAAGWSVRRLGGRIRHDAGPVVAGQAGAAAAVAVLAGALLPGDVSVTTPWASMVGAGMLAGLAAGAGVLRVCGLPPGWTRMLRGWPRAGLAGALAGAVGLLASGALVVLLGLVIKAGVVADSFAGLAPGPGAGAGVLLLAVGYLPNTVVAGVAWALGPGFSIGAAEYGPFATLAGPLPPFPLFAAVPAEPVPGWAAVVLLLPSGAGVAAGVVARRALGADAPLRDRVTAAVAGAAAAAAGAGIVAAVAGGSLAGGPYDPVSLSPVGVLLTALLLLGVPATIAAVGVDELLGRPPSSHRRAGGRTRPSSGRDGVAARGERSARNGRPERNGSERSGSERNGSERNGVGRGGAGRSGGSDRSGPERKGAEPDESAGRDRPARDGSARAGRRQKNGTREKTVRGAPDGDDGNDGKDEKDGKSAKGAKGAKGAARDRTARSSRSAAARSGRSRVASTPGGAGDDTSRPRTVGDLVAQQESAREADAPSTEKPDAEPADAGGGGRDDGDTGDTGDR